MRHGFPLSEIQEITGYDPWFLGEIEAIIQTEADIKKTGLPKDERGPAVSSPWAFPMHAWPN